MKSLPSLPDIFVPMGTGEDKRIKEFYQSRGLERVIQPAGDGESSIQKHVSPTFPGFEFACGWIILNRSVTDQTVFNTSHGSTGLKPHFPCLNQLLVVKTAKNAMHRCSHTVCFSAPCSVKSNM